MKRYTHDYTKAAVAHEYMYFAYLAARTGDKDRAVKHILNARQLMDEYLASDNMVPSEAIAYGWYRAEEVDHKL